MSGNLPVQYPTNQDQLKLSDIASNSACVAHIEKGKNKRYGIKLQVVSSPAGCPMAPRDILGR